MNADPWDTWNFGAEEDPDYRRNAVERRLLAPLGITATEGVIGGKSHPQNIPESITSGSSILRSSPYLAGSSLTSIGRSDGREDHRGRHDLTLWGCLEHPRLQIQVKLYASGDGSRSFLVDGEPFAELDKAASTLETREAESGIYPRPAFTAGTPEDRDD